MLYRFIKYSLDFLIGLIGVIILLPIIIVIGLIIKLTSKGPILFKQKRVGKNKKLFNIYKFRTMKVEAPKETPTHMLDNPDIYITKIGKFLRKTSLDEIPQLFNILFFQMSIVGPRPALWNQYDLIEERDKYNVNKLRPGITGLAQVNGRDELPIPLKAKLDGDYLVNQSLFFDIKIFFKTIFTVLKSDGVKEGKTKDEIDVEGAKLWT